jgi:hypothetical protein
MVGVCVARRRKQKKMDIDGRKKCISHIITALPSPFSDRSIKMKENSI